ncbi:hypothetical protein M0R45_009073 [Rubus argutus]|uniref:Uncharacterized protein n=1 Tax=Rubus argutus TaxID=59490 RepID=A0AAW1Y4Y3_RUBAR
MVRWLKAEAAARWLEARACGGGVGWLGTDCDGGGAGGAVRKGSTAARRSLQWSTGSCAGETSDLRMVMDACCERESVRHGGAGGAVRCAGWEGGGDGVMVSWNLQQRSSNGDDQ